MDNSVCGEKIGVKKIKLVKPELGTLAVAGSFANADSFLMAWCSSSNGWLRCKFEIEYLDEHVLKGEYKTRRKKDGRVSLSHHIQSTFCKMLERSDVFSNSETTFDDVEIQLWVGNDTSRIGADFLDRYETADYSKA